MHRALFVSTASSPRQQVFVIIYLLFIPLIIPGLFGTVFLRSPTSPACFSDNWNYRIRQGDLETWL